MSSAPTGKPERPSPGRPHRAGSGLGVLVLLVAVLAHEAKASATEPPWLLDISEAAGLSFVHQAAHSPEHLYPETFGAGVALLDLDGDGKLDLLLLDSGSPPGADKPLLGRHASYRNLGVGPSGQLSFESSPVPLLPGITAMGACVGDVDGDGDSDLYVTGLPEGRLLLNEEGHLRVSPSSGIKDPGWGSSCVFLDHDLDGDLDLYVAHYVKWSRAEERSCGGELDGFQSYCPPSTYPAQADRLLAGDGRGHFVDVSARAGLLEKPRRGLGVVAGDFNRDGWPDLYLANDEDRNQLLLGSEQGVFQDVGLASGTALGPEGRTQAGMGVDAADLNGDGLLDLWVTNLDLETNNLYLSRRPGRTPRFRDAVHSAGLGRLSLMALGFGTAFADLDLDGDQDLFVANGHIIPDIATLRPDQTWAMADQLFENTGTPDTPKFADAAASWLPASARKLVSRGLALGDLDNDGDLDLIVTSNGGPTRLLLNTTQAGNRWLGLSLKATRSAPGAPLATAQLQLGGQELTAHRRNGGSYLSAHDARLVFSLGEEGEGPHRVRVSWPSGLQEWHGPLATGQYHVLTEGSGRKDEVSLAVEPEGDQPSGSPR